jgi:hypothetical protein
MIKALLATALVALPCAALGQAARPQPLPAQQPPQQAPQPQTAPAQQPPAAEAKPEACANFAMAQNAIYAAYIRLIADELPDPAKVQGEAMKDALEAAYTRQVETARGGDINAVRKATAYELFGMQIQRLPPADSTQERLCVLAKAPGREALVDTLACAVSTLDGPRKERPGAKEAARAMMEKAAASIPAEANASDLGKLLYDSVARGMAGCY